MSVCYFKDTLESGLRVVTVEAPHLHAAVLCAYVRTGSRYETPEENGVSHFLEHMFFRGSRRFPDTVKMNAAIEDVGGNLNGVTTRDHGYYFTPLHPAHIGVGIQILGDILTSPLLKHMDLEREIILEEMLDEVDEKGRDIDVDNLSKMELFAQHPLSLKIAGTPKTVRELTLDHLQRHLQKYYVSSNIVVAGAGPLKRAPFLEQVAQAFAGLSRENGIVQTPSAPRRRGPWFKFVEHTESQTVFRLSFLTTSEEHEDFLALSLIRRILDDGLSSRLPFNIVEKRGLAYSLHAAQESYEDVGLFEIDAACAPAKAALVTEEILRNLAALCHEPVTAEELARAKRRHRIQIEFAYDSPADLAGWFGGTELFRTPESFERRCEQADRVTAERLIEVARRYFQPEGLGAVAVGQKKGIAALESAVRNSSVL